MTNRTISIREDQDKWLKENYVSLSKLVQERLDELMARKEAQKT